MATTSEKRKQWERTRLRYFAMKCSVKSEQDLIQWLDGHAPANAYLKKLVRKEMQDNKTNQN